MYYRQFTAKGCLMLPVGALELEALLGFDRCWGTDGLFCVGADGQMRAVGSLGRDGRVRG